MTIATIEPVTPKAALDALFARGQRLDPSFHWQDRWQEDHANGFTVARSAGFDVLGDIYSAVEDLVANGKTIAEATRDLTPILQAKGWWGRQLTKDPVTGEEVISQLGSTRRLQTIFDANLRVSYASGHWTRFEATKATRPFLRYVCILDAKTRPTHRAHHNLCLPVDDPYWDIWAPPCGWNCRCTLQSLSQRDVDAMGDKLFFKPPSIPNRSWVNKRTGEVSIIPEGIDPGWGYNPGKAGSRAASAYADKLITAPVDLAAAAVSSPSWPKQQLADEFAGWVDQLVARRPGTPPVSTPAMTIGGFNVETLQALRTIAHIDPQSDAITAGQNAILHAIRDAKAATGQMMPIDLIRRMPEYIASPKAVLWDIRNRTVLFVFDVDRSGQSGKLVVRVDITGKVPQPDGSIKRERTNAFVTAGVVPTHNLADANSYVVLIGSLI